MFNFKKIKKLEKKNTELSGRVEELSRDITEYIYKKVARDDYRGNEYTDYDNAVEAICEKYNGTAEWGCEQIGNIIDIRTHFIGGQGLIVKSSSKDAVNEKAFAEEFVDYNKLNDDGDYISDIIKQGEKEGKVFIQLFWDEDHEWFYKDKDEEEIKKTGMVKIRVRPWRTLKYTVTASDEDYFDYTKISWTKGKKSTVLKQNEFSYIRFGGEIDEADSASPKLWNCLTSINHVSRSLRDIREINHSFCAPLLDIQCETVEQAVKTQEMVANSNFKVKKVLVHTGELNSITLDREGVDSCIKEIKINAQMISGQTGVPIHYLGLTDLMSNRSTAEELYEFIIASTGDERKKYQQLFNDVLDKAIDLYIEKTKSSMYRKASVNLSILLITKNQWAHLEKIYLRGYESEAYSKRLVLENTPGVDVERELEESGSRDSEIIKRVLAETPTESLE